MPHKQIGFLMAAALMTAATACSAGVAAVSATGAWTASTGAAAAAAAAAGPVEVMSVSFVSPRVGWLLGERGERASRVLMRATVNGGKTWVAVPAPAAPAADMFQSSRPPDAVGSILFTSRRDGWAFGPALWRTTDGGATWRRERVPGPVANLEVTGNRMIAVITRPGDAGLRLYAATAGRDDWRPVPGAAVADFRGESLAVSGGRGYLLASLSSLARPVLLTGPADGGGRWHAVPVPCPGGWSAAIAATPGWLFVGCGGEPGAGNQLKTGYVSRDGGRAWHQVAGPPMGGYLGGAAMSPGGTIFLSGERMDIYISRDRGRSWHESPSLRNAAGLAGAGFSLAAATLTDRIGVAFEKGAGTRQVWLTGDGGRRWTPVTVR
jgi:photosystem II stability/assembly factor-like uncharacterized protein